MSLSQQIRTGPEELFTFRNFVGFVLFFLRRALKIVKKALSEEEAQWHGTELFD